MSMDRPSSSGDSGGDSRPERGDRPADRNGERPFPGAPLDRPAAPPSAGPVRSWEDIKEDKHRYTSQAEYEAVLRERAAGSRSPDSAGTSGPPDLSGSTNSVPDRPGPSQPDGIRDAGRRRPESTKPTRPERSAEGLFPGAPLDRPAVPLSAGPARSWEEIREDKTRFSSQRAYDQARADEKGGGRTGTEENAAGGAGTSGKDALSSSREAPSKEKPEARDPVREVRAQAEGEKRDGDDAEQTPTDRVRVQHAAADTGADQVGEQNWGTAIEQRVQSVVDQRIQAALDGVKAEYDAKLESKLEKQKAEPEAEIEGIKAEYEGKLASHESRLGELEAKAEDRQEGGPGQPDRSLHEDVKPDAVKAEQRGDRPRQGVKDPERGAEEQDRLAEQSALLGGNEAADQRSDARHDDVDEAKVPRWRRVATSENVNAVGTVVGAANTAAMFAVHATPDGVVSLGLTVLGVAGLAMSKIEKPRKDKNERPD